MNNWIPVSKTNHAHATWIKRQNFTFAESMQTVPILMAELNKLIPQYVMAFLKNNDTVSIVAVLGLGADKNLYLGGAGEWLAEYTPARLRAYPFALLPNNEGEKILCISESHLTQSLDAHRMFNGDALDESVSEYLNLLNLCEQNQLITQAACNLLDAVGIIEPWRITLKDAKDESTSTEIQGLYRINEDKLNELDSTQFLTLRSNGALALAYAQLFSISQLDQIGKRAEYFSQQLSTKKTAHLDSIFGENETISFSNL